MKTSSEHEWHNFSHMVFDIDGTLVNSNIAHVWSWQDAFEQQNLFFPHLSMLLQMGLPGKEIVEKFSFAFPDDATANRVRQAASEIYAEKYVKLVTVFDGTYELLDELKHQRKKLYALTSASKRESDSMLDHFRLREFFDVVITGDDVSEGKPTPEPFNIIRHHAGSNTSIISFGDSPYDLAASEKAGVPFVFLGAGAFPREWFTKRSMAYFLNIRDLLSSLPHAVRQRVA